MKIASKSHINLKTICLSFFLLSLIQLMTAQEKPNIIFILTDDQSYGMLGCTGNTVVQTPNIDKLASEGVLFTNAHVTSAICTPSRASILTSQFERKHNINFNSGTSMSEEAWKNTYPVVMRNHGYYTGWIGKNHVPIGEGGYESGLMEKSFDYWYAGHGHLRFYPKKIHDIFKNAKHDTQVEVVGEGIQDFLSNEQKLEGAVKFIDQRPKNKPFMLSVSFNLPHGAGTSTMEMRETDDEIYRTLYRDKEIALPKNYIARDSIKTPKLPIEIHHAEDRQVSYDWVNTPQSYQERMVRQYQAMTGIDRLVGQLQVTLKKQKLEKNTIIIFTSDHGLFGGQFGLGGKALCYEVATHVPIIFYNPQAKTKNKKRKSDALVQTIDIAPTMLSMAGISIPETYQGRDLTPLLNQEKISIRDYLYTENLWSTSFGNPRCESVQNAEWKYIRYYKNNNPSALNQIAVAKEMNIPLANVLYRVYDKQLTLYRSFVEGPLNGEETVYEELYNLKVDPNETTNLIADKSLSEVLSNLKLVWKQKIINARGTENPKVLRYTTDSTFEKGLLIEPK